MQRKRSTVKLVLVVLVLMPGSDLVYIDNLQGHKIIMLAALIKWASRTRVL